MTAPDLCNIDAEQALLGAALIDASQIEAISSIVDAGHFFEPLHGQIYTASCQLVQNGRPVTPVTLEPFFRDAEPVGELTVVQYLGRLLAAATTAKNASAYAHVVRDYAGRRAISEAGLRMQQLASDHGSSVEQMAADAIKSLDAIVGSARPESYGYADTDGVMHMVRDRRARGGGITGISTGYPKLDDMIDGLRPSTLTVIGARPKQGKTAILLSIIRNLCKTNVKCMFFSLEMPRDQIVMRLIAMEAGIDFVAFSRGRYDAADEQAIDDAAIAVDGWPLLIDDAAGLTPSAVAARARTAVKSDGCKAVFIDYIQRISQIPGFRE